MTGAQATAAAGNAAGKIEVENVNLPGHSRRVDAGKYEAMKQAMLKTLPATSPGLTLAELRPRLYPQLPEDLFLAVPPPVGGSRRCSSIWKRKA